MKRFVAGCVVIAITVPVLLTLGGCPSSSSSAEITVSSASTDAIVGGTLALTASSTDADDTFSWASNDTGVATVASDGVVTGVSAGTATITATGSHSGSTGSLDISVSATSTGADSDSDGLSDDDEADEGTDPDDEDSDDDGLTDGEEVYTYRTYPLYSDTDGDGLDDGDEVANGGDPLYAEDAPELYNEIQHAIWDALDVFNEQAASKSMAGAMAAAAAHLETDPNVSSVNYEEATASTDWSFWAEFSNGVVFVLSEASCVEEIDKAGQPIPDPAPSAGAASPAAKSLPCIYGLPQNPFVLMNLYKPGTNVSNASDLKAVLESYGHAPEYYNYQSADGGGVEFFKDVADYGLVYVDTHGFWFRDLTEPTAPVEYCGVQTNDMRNKTQDATYLDNGDFTERRVMVGGSVIQKRRDLFWARRHVCYYVTNAFFDTYCGEFEDHSFVWFNACKTAASHVNYTTAPLFVSLMDKNAGTVLGWDRIVTDASAIRASEYVFSRLLGYNGYFPRTPPIRPYDINSVFVGLRELAYELDEFSRSGPPWPELCYNVRDAMTATQEMFMLAPAIYYTVGLQVDPSDNSLDLTGYFGDREPTVTVGGTPLTVREFTDREMTLDIPSSAHGQIVVSVDGSESNAVPLSQWEGQVLVSGEASDIGPRLDALARYRFRGDVHPYRDLPEDAVGRAAGSPRSATCRFETDSEFEYAYSGTFFDSQYMYEYSGSNTVPLSAYKKGAKADTYSGAAYLTPDGSSGPGSGTYQMTITAMTTYHLKKTDLLSGAVTESDPTELFIITINDSIGHYGTIPAGTSTYNNYDLSWQECVPDPAPDASTPG